MPQINSAWLRQETSKMFAVYDNTSVQKHAAYGEVLYFFYMGEGNCWGVQFCIVNIWAWKMLTLRILKPDFLSSGDMHWYNVNNNNLLVKPRMVYSTMTNTGSSCTINTLVWGLKSNCAMKPKAAPSVNVTHFWNGQNYGETLKRKTITGNVPAWILYFSSDMLGHNLKDWEHVANPWCPFSPLMHPISHLGIVCFDSQ